MPRIKRSCIEDIRQRVSLVEVAETYTHMKRAGAQFRGLSPFNNEKTPSFYIHPEKNVFHDYSSGNAGDLFRFVQLRENLSFHEAVETIARRYGITLDYEDDGRPPEHASLRGELFELHEAAVDFYHRQLMADTPAAQSMRDYWTAQRKFPISLAEEFKIGYAPPDGSGLIAFLEKKKYSLNALRESGLLYLSEHARDLSRAKARFRGRLMIPIRDVQGRAIAFTARQTEQTPQDDPSREAKYINSPETPIFSKSHVLFGLERARTHLSEGEPLIMVEGQLDCLRCCQCGVGNAIAPQGTAITEHQMSLARRYTNKLECLLDGDSAGQKAALRMLPLALQAGLEVSFLRLPGGKDPDDLLREGGAEALEAIRKEAIPAVEFAVRSRLPKGRQPSAQETIEIVEWLAGMLRDSSAGAAAVRDYFPGLQRYTGVDFSAYRGLFTSVLTGKPSVRPAATAPGEAANQKLTSAEEDLLSLALHHESIGEKLSHVIDFEWIDTNERAGGLLRRVLAAFAEREWPGSSNIDALLENDEEHNYIYRLLSRPPTVENPLASANQCLSMIFNRFLSEKSKQIDTSIINETNPEKRLSLYGQRQELRKYKQSPPAINE